MSAIQRSARQTLRRVKWKIDPSRSQFRLEGLVTGLCWASYPLSTSIESLMIIRIFSISAHCLHPCIADFRPVASGRRGGDCIALPR